MTAQPSLQEIVERYKKLDSALIYDTLDAMGLSAQQLDLEIKPLAINMVVAGPAFTSKWVVSEETKKVTSPRLEVRSNSYQMLKEMTPGCVYIEDVGNDPVSGGLGENLGISVKLAGATGVVCDGGTRDRKALIAMGFPVFSRFSSCTFSWGRRRFIDYQIPIRLSGHVSKWVTVNPGTSSLGIATGSSSSRKISLLRSWKAPRRWRRSRRISGSASWPAKSASRSTRSTATPTSAGS